MKSYFREEKVSNIFFNGLLAIIFAIISIEESLTGSNTGGILFLLLAGCCVNKLVRTHIFINKVEKEVVELEQQFKVAIIKVEHDKRRIIREIKIYQ